MRCARSCPSRRHPPRAASRSPARRRSDCRGRSLWLDPNVAWIEAPRWLEVVAQAVRTGWALAVVDGLRIRFGEIPATLMADLQRVPSKQQADRFLNQAVCCPTLEAFVNALRSGPQPSDCRE